MAPVSTGKVLAGIAAALVVGGGLVAYEFNGGPNDFPTLAESAASASETEQPQKEEAKEEVKEEDVKKDASKEPAKVEVEGDKVENLRTDVAKNPAAFCKNSDLKAGEGKGDKGGTCLSIPIGEIPKNPILVAIPNAPEVVAEGEAFELKVQIEDKFGPLDLNAFTFDDSGKAGVTFLEHPGELDNDGRPLLHAHLGVATLKEENGLPVSAKYDAAFSGVQGVKGDLTAKVGGLKAGFYRADIYTGQPGHAPYPTAKADNIQGFASFYFEVK